MSYADMARSHVKELARQAFELEQVVEDEEGDLPFPCGTAMLFLSVVDDGRLVRAWSVAARGVPVTKAVLRELNDANAGAVMARVWAIGRDVVVESHLPVEGLTLRDFRSFSLEVGSVADRLGSMLAAVHGGRVAFPDGCPAPHGPD